MGPQPSQVKSHTSERTDIHVPLGWGGEPTASGPATQLWEGKKVQTQPHGPMQRIEKNSSCRGIRDVLKEAVRPEQQVPLCLED